MRVLAIDPGRDKCGAAVLEPGRVLAHRVVRSDDLASVTREWVETFHVDRIVVGNRTGSREVHATLRTVRVPVQTVDEQGTTLAARHRYFEDHPPRGWRRFLPLSFQMPSEPYDDYAAIVIAEAYLRAVGA